MLRLVEHEKMFYNHEARQLAVHLHILHMYVKPIICMKYEPRHDKP